MSDVPRYVMSADEILEVMVWNQENGYGSVTLQAGEREDVSFVNFVEQVLQRAKVEAPQVGITLCCGEQTEEVYQRWLAAGAHRYLLRIETTNPVLYRELHPEDHRLERRIECLHTLKRLGYQVGTGVMIGLPNQTYLDLAKDILFFKEMGVHMIGMGPYIVQKETPTGQKALNSPEEVARRFQLSLNMIAVTRLFLPKLNIASTTALQALDPKGREQGVRCGANILMPIATPLKYRASYQLYDDKPCIEDTTAHCKVCIIGRMRSVNRRIGFNQRGDAPAVADVFNFTKPEK
jgi:biotin synthase